MTCSDAAAKIAGWRDSGGLDRGEIEELRTHVGSCDACGKRYRTLMLLVDRESGELRKTARRAGAPDIAGAVMERIARRGLRPEGRRRTAFSVPRMAAAAAVLVMAVLFLIPGLFSGTRGGDEIAVIFTVDAPEADSVVLTGNFSDWQPEGYPMKKRGDGGRWEIRLRLKKGGLYTYNFIIDGEKWIPDPAVPFRVNDGFGGESSLLQL